MITASRSRNVLRAPTAMAAALALTAAVLAGCSTTGAAPTTTTASTGPTSSSASGEIATARAFANRYLKAPTTIGVTAPLKTVPPTGKTIALLQCEVQQCADLGTGVHAAAASVGWSVTTFPWSSTNPATFVSALQQVLTMSPKPVAVIFSGLPEAVWSAEVPAFRSAGIPMIPTILGPVTLNDTVIADLYGPTDVELQGKILASWFIADSHAKGKALQQDIPTFPTIGEIGAGFRSTVAAGCKSCSVTTIDSTATQIASNQITPSIVSALQRDPSIGYVASSDIAFAPGLPSSLHAAGISNVKITGGAADSTYEQSLRDGTGSAFVTNDLPYAGWLAVDVALRHMQGIPFVPDDGGIPTQLLTRATVAPVGQSENLPTDYPTMFKKLWKVS